MLQVRYIAVSAVTTLTIFSSGFAHAQQGASNDTTNQTKEFQLALERCGKLNPPHGVRARIRLQKGQPQRIYDCDSDTAPGKEAKCAQYEDQDGSLSEACSGAGSAVPPGRICTLSIGEEVNANCIPSIGPEAIAVKSAASFVTPQYIDDFSGHPQFPNAVADQVMQQGVLQPDGSYSLPASQIMNERYPGLLDSVQPRSPDAAAYLGNETDDQRASRALLQIAKDNTNEGLIQLAESGNSYALDPSESIRYANKSQLRVDNAISTGLPNVSSFPSVTSPVNPFGMSGQSTFVSPVISIASANEKSIAGDRESGNIVDLRPGSTYGTSEWTHVITTEVRDSWQAIKKWYSSLW